MHDSLGFVAHGVNKLTWAVIIDKAAKVTLDYTFVKRNDICSKFYVKCPLFVFNSHVTYFGTS